MSRSRASTCVVGKQLSVPRSEEISIIEAVSSLSSACSSRGQKVKSGTSYKKARMTSKILSKSEQLQFSMDRHRMRTMREKCVTGLS